MLLSSRRSTSLPVHFLSALFLLRSPEEAREFVSGFGFDVDVAHSFPGANLSLHRALATESTISCVFVLTKPAA